MKHLTEEQLNEYLDGLLDESACQDVEAHLVECTDCCAQMEDLELVFANLDELPEAQLRHDLMPSVLARLPQKTSVHVWTRALAAQLGVVVVFIFWLGIQAIPLVGISQLSLLKFLAFDIRVLFMRLLSIQIPISEFRILSVNLELLANTFQIPIFGLSTRFKTAIQLSTTHLTLLIILSLFLWVVGNAILLRNRQEASSCPRQCRRHR